MFHHPHPQLEYSIVFNPTVNYMNYWKVLRMPYAGALKCLFLGQKKRHKHETIVKYANRLQQTLKRLSVGLPLRKPNCELGVRSVSHKKHAMTACDVPALD